MSSRAGVVRLPVQIYPRSSDVLMGLKVSVVSATPLLDDDRTVMSSSVTITSSSTSLHLATGELMNPGTACMIQLMVNSDPATGLPVLLMVIDRGVGGTVCVCVWWSWGGEE